MTRGGKTFFITLAGGVALCALLALASNRLARQAAAYNPTRICDNAFEKQADYLNSTENHISVTLGEGCFGPLIRLPAAWHGTFVHPKGKQENWWLAYWVIADPRPQGPFGPNQIAGVNARGLYFRVQGHGEVVFYSNDMSGTSLDKFQGRETDAPTMSVTKIDVNATDPHLCQKPDDAYFAQYGPAVPMPAGSGEFRNPDFQFDQKHGDNKVNWANGFKGKLIVCFLVDVNGVPTNISFPQSPGADLEAHIKDYISGWRYKPGSYTTSYLDRVPKYVPTQMATEFRFP